MIDFLDLVQSFQMALKTLVMYTGSHPRSHAAIDGLGRQLAEWLEAKPAIHIAASQNKVFVDGAPVMGRSVHLAALAKQFTERQISGLILLRGITAEELEELLAILILKPAKVEEAGGALALFARKNLPHVQLGQTQYKEVREGEGGEEDDQRGPAMGLGKDQAEAVEAAALAALASLAAPPPAAAPAPAKDSGPGAPGFDLQIITDEWEEQLEQIPHRSLLEDAFEPANLGVLGGTPSSIGMGDGFPPAHQVEGLRRALLALPPETLLAVVAGLDTLPSAPPGLRLGFQSLAGEAFAQAGAALLDGDLPWAPVREALFETLRYAPQQQSMLAALEAELRTRGAGAGALGRFQELVEQLDWEHQSMEEKLHQADERGRLWTISLDQRLKFLRSLLDEGRIEGFLGLLEQVLEGLREDEPAQRDLAARTVNGVARWLENPGLPIEAEGGIIQGLTAHFGWEPLVHIHRISTEALTVVVNAQVNRGEPGHALALLQELKGLCAFQDNGQEWREAALAHLWDRLADPDALRKVTELLHTANAETMLGELIPYLEAVGEPASRLLVALLGDEPDRKRRGRLLEAIRGLGDAALPAIMEGLASPSWYLVRNTLNLLADIGDAGALAAAGGCLTHPDGRVKRAAVRTLWKVGGPAAVEPLLAAFPAVDPETQEEIMFGLGQVRSIKAVATLAGYAQERRNPERLRARALETIGQIGDPGAIQVLADLARRKGLIFSTAEPVEVRLGACRALLALACPEAMTALTDLVAAEPWSKDRSVLQQVIDNHRPA